MSEYLSKEEIKQWRSSLEKITLEEFAARLGKKVEQKKETNDLIDIVLHGKPVVSDDFNWNAPKVERLTSIADKAYEKEKELYVSPFSAQNLKLDKDVKPAKDKKPAAKKSAIKAETLAKPAKTKTLSASKKSAKALETAKQVIETPDTSDMLRNEVRVVFKKALTDREQKVFDYFAAHRNQIVYAKDLAELLSLPRDYVYKYIKNLRAKIDGEALKNADKGGFVLTI